MREQDFINEYNELVEAKKKAQEASNNTTNINVEAIEAAQFNTVAPEISEDLSTSKEAYLTKQLDNEIAQAAEAKQAYAVENDFLRQKLVSQKKAEKNRLILMLIILGMIVLGGMSMIFSINYLGDVESAPAPTTQPADTTYINEIYEANRSAVISVVNLKEITLGEFFNEPYATDVQQSSGSGFVYKYENGQYYAITNYHVVEGGDALQVVVDNHTEEPLVIDAEFLGGSKTYDIAVITFKTNYEINPVVIGDSDELTVGEPVVAMGSPYGTEFQGSVTSGIISGPTRTFTEGESSLNYIQTDAAINSGNSGGPLFNTQGEVIGVNSMKIADGSTDNMAFAIPINDVMEVVAQIEASAEGEDIVTN